MNRPFVVLGAVEAIVRQALLSASRDELTIRESSATGHDLVEEARAAGAHAIVVGLDDAEEVCVLLPPEVTVVGLSSSRFEALVRRGGETTVIRNPTPDEILALVRTL